MRFGLLVTSPLMWLLFLNIILRNIVTAQVEQTFALTNISRTVIIEPLVKKSVHSTLSAVDSEKWNSQMVVVNNSEIKVASFRPEKISTTINKKERSPIVNAEKESNQNPPSSIVFTKPDEFMVTKSLLKPERSTVLSEEFQARFSTKEKVISLNSPASIAPHKSKLLLPLASSPKPELYSVFPNVHGTTKTTHPEHEINKNVTSFISEKYSEIGVQVTTTSAIPKDPLHISATLGTSSSTRTEQSASYSKIMSEKPHIQANATIRILSVQVNQENKTFVLKSSPSMMTNKHQTQLNIAFTSSLVDITELSNNKSIFESRVYSASNDTYYQHSITEGTLSKYNHTSGIKFAEEKLPDKTISMIKDEIRTITMESETKHSITKSSVLEKFDNRTSIPVPRLLIYSSKVYVSHNIHPMLSRTNITSNTILSGKSTKTEIHTFSSNSNNTQIRDILDNSMTYGVIKPSSRLPTFSKQVTNRTKDIKVLPLMTIAKTSQKTYTKHAGDPTNSIRKVGVSKRSKEIKPTAGFSYSTTQQITSRQTIPQTKMKKQQFRVTFKITSEQYKEEYSTSTRAFRKKSKEIEEEFDRVLKNVIIEYLYTEVVSFFSGSLGCVAIIHTESKESEPVSADKLKETLVQAKNTEGGFKKFVVGEVDIKEKSPDVQGRDDDEEEKTWGRWPIVVISILGGVCVVLFVVVITQCIQKRHYSHSLAESNGIQDWSPDIQLKNHDDSVYKDEERVPMTTFNQTDIY